MRMIKSLSGLACAVVACASVSFAQDDLDSLLSDLESSGKKKAAAPAEAAAEA